MPRRNRNSAFSMIEIMVAVAIFAIMSVGIMSLIVNTLHSYYTLSALNELGDNGSFAVDEIVRDLRASSMETVTQPFVIQDPATGQFHDILVFVSTEGPNSPTDANGNPDWQSAVCYYTFTTATGLAQLRKYVHTDTTLTEGDFPMTVAVSAA